MPVPDYAADYFVWDVSPELFSIGPIVIRWYGLLFACGFLFGFQLMGWIYKREGKPVQDLDRLFIYMVLGTVIGARLGHCLFYHPSYYLTHPLEILMVWHGGLASHGATIGILLALYLYCRKAKDQPYLWLVSRMTLIVALAAIFIRIGNFFNSEIIGIPSDLPWAVLFVRNHEFGAIVPRHPAQLYESFAYFWIFIILMLTYIKCGKDTQPELLLGLFFTLVFSARYLIEFVKTIQSGFENSMTLHMGQLLSLPLILFGLYMLFLAYRNRKKSSHAAVTKK
ncbi:MAG: prolipoprotein diacylglyceryl transferase [Bdellovibrionota bacterium]|jgi:phosphatidylglycerol:prolipoprotein diacylglycerol transferase